MTMRRVFVVISLIVLGAAAGVSADRMLHRGAAVTAVRFSDVYDDPVGLIASQIELTPAQRTEIAAILDRRQDDLDAAWRAARARMAATADSVIGEIANVLDEADRARFRALADSIHNTPHLRLRH